MSLLDDMTEIETLVLSLYEIEAVKFGRFKLASGKTSPIYIDLRLLISRPDVLRLAARTYASLLDSVAYDLLGAIPYGGLPIGTAIALETGKPLIFPRKAAKSYGTGKTIEGRWTIGQKVVIIEDLVTTGESALGGVAILKAAGLQVSDIVVLLDRQQGAKATIAERGYNLHSVLNLDQMLVILEHHDRIKGKTRRKVLEALN